MTAYGVVLRAGVAAVLVLLLAACGTAAPAAEPEAQATAAAGTTFNGTDVMYVQMMLAHHAQGLELVRLADARAAGEEVRLLAAAVEATQADEVTLMTSWLTAWSKPTEVGHDMAAHAAHGGLPATGAEQIAALETTSGASFDTMFLTLFTAHQHVAVELARLELDTGIHPEARELARRIQQSRTDQIGQMLTLLNS